MHNPSEVDKNQLLLVRFPNLSSDNVTIQGTESLSFSNELSLTADTKIALVSNVDRTIMKKLAVKFERNEIFGVDYFNVFAYYR